MDRTELSIINFTKLFILTRSSRLPILLNVCVSSRPRVGARELCSAEVCFILGSFFDFRF